MPNLQTCGGAAATQACAPAAHASAQPVLHQPKSRRTAGRKLTLALFILAAVALIAIVVCGANIGPKATIADFSAKNIAPCWEHLFGTDRMGRDMLARTLAGLATSVLVGLLAASVSSLIALALGTLAALGGKRADAVVTWLIDLMMGIPHIVLLILISYALGKGF